jgi:hypothetical protein
MKRISILCLGKAFTYKKFFKDDPKYYGNAKCPSQEAEYFFDFQDSGIYNRLRLVVTRAINTK